MMVNKQVCEASTDGSGTLTPRKKLDPNTSYNVCRWEDVPADIPHPSRDKVVEWISDCVLGDLRTLQLGMVQRRAGGSHSNSLGGGNFLLAAACCMAIEYCGNVYNVGSNGTERAKSFVTQFLAPVDARYLEFFELIWGSIRNGIIHGSWAQTLHIRDQEAPRLVVGAATSDEGQHFERVTWANRPTFILNSERFLRDLETAVNPSFRTWILEVADDAVRERASASLLAIHPDNTRLSAQFMKAVRWTTGAV
jgi:hypothetical protein